MQTPTHVDRQRVWFVFDDTVLEWRYAIKMALVHRQYSGFPKVVINGIGVVTCVYVNPVTDQFWLIDFRIYDPDGLRINLQFGPRQRHPVTHLVKSQ